MEGALLRSLQARERERERERAGGNRRWEKMKRRGSCRQGRKKRKRENGVWGDRATGREREGKEKKRKKRKGMEEKK
jgi:hypothetical protein